MGHETKSSQFGGHENPDKNSRLRTGQISAREVRGNRLQRNLQGQEIASDDIELRTPQDLSQVKWKRQVEANRRAFAQKRAPYLEDQGLVDDVFTRLIETAVVQDTEAGRTRPLVEAARDAREDGETWQRRVLELHARLDDYRGEVNCTPLYWNYNDGEETAYVGLAIKTSNNKDDHEFLLVFNNGDRHVIVPGDPDKQKVYEDYLENTDPERGIGFTVKASGVTEDEILTPESAKLYLDSFTETEGALVKFSLIKREGQESGDRAEVIAATERALAAIDEVPSMQAAEVDEEVIAIFSQQLEEYDRIKLQDEARAVDEKFGEIIGEQAAELTKGLQRAYINQKADEAEGIKAGGKDILRMVDAEAKPLMRMREMVKDPLTQIITPRIIRKNLDTGKSEVFGLTILMHDEIGAPMGLVITEERVFTLVPEDTSHDSIMKFGASLSNDREFNQTGDASANQELYMHAAGDGLEANAALLWGGQVTLSSNNPDEVSDLAKVVGAIQPQMAKKREEILSGIAAKFMDELEERGIFEGRNVPPAQAAP